MRLLGYLGVFVSLTLWFSAPPDVNAQSPAGTMARSLDAILQDYAFRALVSPLTGKPYEAVAPANLTGIKITSTRLKNGSLRKRGFFALKEFTIPSGIIVEPYVTRLVLVSQNLHNFSELYYPLPGYDYLAPVLGLLAYDAKNLSAKNLPELEIETSNDPIRVVFSDLKRLKKGSNASCVTFDLNGTVIFSDVVDPGNICRAMKQGHFSIVVKSVRASKTWVIVGSVGGGLLFLVLMTFILFWIRNKRREKRIQEMELSASLGETIRTTLVGDSRVPVASSIRTQPMLEMD